jgi:hypothetical protein
MLKTLVILIALLIAAVNVSAQSNGSGKRAFGGRHIVRRPAVVRVGPATTYLKEGFTIQEVLRLLGEPAAVSERAENGTAVKTYEFPRGDKRILVAVFVNDALVSSRTETRGLVAWEGR